MSGYVPDDEARDRRLAAIRARRGTPERRARIEALRADRTVRSEKGLSRKGSHSDSIAVSPRRGPVSGREAVEDMRRLALEAIHRATGLWPVRTDGQTYRLPNETKFHLRTRQRDEQAGGWVRYWFGIQEHLWRPADFFVLVCDLDFVLVVPVSEWLPHMEHFSISDPGPGQSRQPHIYWRGSTYELREASRSVPLTLDVRPWVDNLSVLSGM